MKDIHRQRPPHIINTFYEKLEMHFKLQYIKWNNNGLLGNSERRWGITDKGIQEIQDLQILLKTTI